MGILGKIKSKVRHYRWQRRPSPLPGLLSTTEHDRIVDLQPFAHGETVLKGYPIRFSDNAGFVHSVREVFAGEVYRFKAKHAAPFIVDAGANIGLSVLYFKTLYPGAEIIAFEPDEAIFGLLKQNVGGLENVTLVRAAIGTENGETTFFTEGSLAGSTSMDFLGGSQAVTVPVVSLKEAIRDREIDFLKIDIEGAENTVIFDIADDLNRVDHLFLEYHSIPGEKQLLGDILTLVRDYGFRYAITDAHGPALPFVEPVSHGFDTQLNISCFRRPEQPKG